MFKKIVLSLSVISSFAFSSEINIKMDGVVDDDLFVYQIHPNSTEIVKLYAAQMHNPNALKNVDGQSVDVKKISYDGKIKLDLKANTKDGIVVISTANEREEIYPFKKIMNRTHYKNSPIYVNSIEVVRSMLPEKNDLNYPTLFQDGENSCASSKGDTEIGNYYKFWENAVIANAVVLQKQGNYKVSYFDEQGNIQHRLKFNISNGQIFDASKTVGGELIESYGEVYTGEQPSNYNVNLVEQNAINHIIIWNEDTGESYKIPFVYKWPYKGMIRFFVPSETSIQK